MRRAQRRAAASPPASQADPLRKGDTGPLLLAQSQALTSRIAAINELAVAINSSPTLDGILPLVAEQAKWILDFEYCAIALLASGDDTYRLEGLFGELGVPGGGRYAAHEGFVGGVVRDQRAAICADLSLWAAGPLGALDVALIAGGGRGALAAPLVAGGQMLGALLFVTRVPDLYTMEDARIVYLLALQVAVALRNVQTLQVEQQRARQYATLARIGRLTSDLPTAPNTLQQVAALLCGAFGYLRVALATIEDGALVFRYIASIYPGESDQVERVPLAGSGPGLTTWVARHDQMVVAHDVHSDPRYVPHPANPLPDPVRAECALPLRGRDGIIGVLDCQSDRPQAFDVDECNLLETVAGQVSAALEARQLYGQVSDLFQKYVSARLARSILAHQTSSELGGVRQEVSVLFADLDNFSPYAENHSPEATIETLQLYLELATEAVLSHGGTLTQYIGDGLMAIFNAPDPDPDHPLRIVQAAWAIQQNVRDYHRRVGRIGLHFAIGLHLGEALVGNLGTAALRTYTAVGDTVNLAKRMQESAGGGEIHLSAPVYARVAAAVSVTPLGAVTIKSRTEPLDLYRLDAVRRAG